MSDQVIQGLRARVGDARADALATQSFSNLPNAVKGAVKFPADPELESGALAVVEDPALAEALGLAPGGTPDQIFWLLLTLAARADLKVVDRMSERLSEDYAVRLLASIRRAGAKHLQAAAKPAPSTDLPDAPQKVSEVKKWLAAHPAADPELLAPFPKQKAASKAAAVRALAGIGTPAALAVLGRYVSDNYPDPMLKELHAAWGCFDRRAFAALMWARQPYSLQVVTDLEGIGAVPDLKRLRVIFMGAADIGPVAECTSLEHLEVGAEGAPGLLSAEPVVDLPHLRELHLTRCTRYADLSVLARSRVERLSINLENADGSFLLDMPNLERLVLTAGIGGHEYREAQEIPPHAGLSDVVLALVRKGVRVVVYRHQRPWVGDLLARIEDLSDIFVASDGSRTALVNDGSSLPRLESLLRSNILL